MHSRDVIHFDLKPDNLLLDESWTIKLSDFGISRRAVSVNAQQGATLVYCAPEVVLQDAADLTVAVDIFSYAIILWELLHRRKAYDDISLPNRAILEAVAVKGMRPKISVGEPVEVVAVMKVR